MHTPEVPHLLRATKEGARQGHNSVALDLLALATDLGQRTDRQRRITSTRLFQEWLEGKGDRTTD